MKKKKITRAIETKYSEKIIGATKKSHNQRVINNFGRKTMEFEILFRHSLDGNFDFSKLKQSGLRQFHQFVEKTVGKNLTWQEVDATMLRIKNGNPWRNEIVNGEDRRVAHYSMGSGRIFGYREGNDFIVYIIDPNHRVDV